MEDTIKSLVELLVYIFAPILGALLVAGLVKLLNLLGLKSVAQAVQNNEQLAINAIAATANKKAKLLKYDGIAMKAEAQLKHAADYILTKNPKISREEAEEWVETVLPKVGEGASATLKLAKDKLDQISQ